MALCFISLVKKLWWWWWSINGGGDALLSNNKNNFEQETRTTSTSPSSSRRWGFPSPPHLVSDLRRSTPTASPVRPSPIQYPFISTFCNHSSFFRIIRVRYLPWTRLTSSRKIPLVATLGYAYPFPFLQFPWFVVVNELFLMNS